MPVSIWNGIEDTLEAIVPLQPRSILDVGIGFGLWGFLLRQYLDVWEGGIHREEWSVLIDGIEIDPSRVQAHAEYLYNNVYIGDVRELIFYHTSKRKYDLIFFGDVIEHLPKKDALAVLNKAVQETGIAVVVRIPLGEGWREEGREPPDHHRSKWKSEDFKQFTSNIRLYDYFGLEYGVVVICKHDSNAALIQRLEKRLERIEKDIERLFPEIKGGNANE